MLTRLRFNTKSNTNEQTVVLKYNEYEYNEKNQVINLVEGILGTVNVYCQTEQCNRNQTEEPEVLEVYYELAPN